MLKKKLGTLKEARNPIPDNIPYFNNSIDFGSFGKVTTILKF